MSVRDPQFTLRLEGALRKLARVPAMSLGYVARAAEIDLADLQAWTDEFCRGNRKMITHARIDEVKRELGSLAEVEVPAAGPAPESKELLNSVSPMGTVAQLPAVVENPKPTAETKLLFKQPKQFQRTAFLKHRPTYLFAAANPELSQSEVCRRLKVQLSAWNCHARSLFGGIPTPEMIRAYIAWGDAMVARAPVEPLKAKTAKDSAPNNAELPRRAIKQLLAAPKVEAAAEKPPTPVKGETIIARHQIPLGCVEVIVRLVPPAGGAS